MLSTRKILVSVAAALILVCGHAFAGQAFDDHDIHLVKVAQDIPAAVSARIEPAVLQQRALQDYRSPAMRSDMRVASAGMVFDSVDRSPPASNWL